MLKPLAEIILNSKIAKGSLNRNKQFLPWDKIKTVALVLNSTDKINKSAIDKFVEGTGKLVSVFYIEPTSKTATYSDWQCLSKKDRTFLGLPHSKFLHQVKDKKFDLVINTSPETDLFSAALTAALTATLKCGGGKKYGELDLIIQKADPYHVIDYLNEVIKYLKMIRA
ncbi:MAG: hypothetical protein V4635_14790 [Bacteroidota bacterium]